MKHSPLIFLGVFFTLTVSWYGMILVPQLQFGRAQQVTAGAANIRYPTERPGLAQQGMDLYRANGCHYCHTQQVRPAISGADIAREWGARFNVAQDYLADYPVMLGQRRIGPDLANVGARVPVSLREQQVVQADTNQVAGLVEWHLRHLYNPKITSPESNMPPYPYLFRHVKRAKDAPPARDALQLPDEFAPEPDGDFVFDVVPKHEAIALVEYMMSLTADISLFEAPIPTQQESETEGGTNQPPAAVGDTNTAPVPDATNQPLGTPNSN